MHILSRKIEILYSFLHPFTGREKKYSDINKLMRALITIKEDLGRVGRIQEIVIYKETPIGKDGAVKFEKFFII